MKSIGTEGAMLGANYYAAGFASLNSPCPPSIIARKSTQNHIMTKDAPVGTLLFAALALVWFVLMAEETTVMENINNTIEPT